MVSEVIAHVVSRVEIGKKDRLWYGVNQISAQEVVVSFELEREKKRTSRTYRLLVIFALVVVLLKAGLGISVQVLRKTWRDSFLLSFIPNLCEALAVTVLSHFLIKLPWLESVMLGFIISAVSPAVVVPSMLRIEKEGYGTKRHVSQIVLTGASLDDIVSITVFGLMLACSLGVMISLIKSPLNQKERVFCVLAYLPKATVQAALGAVPLALVSNSGNLVLIAYATTILSYAVFAILITAPLGLVLVEKTYRQLLEVA
ncbi:sodium/hydrogen exchanger 9B2-like [Centruroides sculpturatus]|uniref:sodium/hydrogen exchanger 9B2-like n=1 Tax=Centruroides sculpturatus TaxID=218467 RepID=UPI000C6E37D4|nr:sodium/hydrogen exchanger 9B2-like [Centruroides sculpturatus]